MTTGPSRLDISNTWSFEPDAEHNYQLYLMNAEKRVAVVGHSLVPRDLGYIRGAEIKIFRSPGARVSNFENGTLSEVLRWPHDLSILFLGGNDIYDGCVPSRIARDIKRMIELVHEHCGSQIAFVLLEHRNPPTRNRFNVSADQYNRVANNINNRLKRKYKNKSYIRFLSVGAKPFQRGVTDGVHFDAETKAHLKQKLRNTIVRFIQAN